jgi:uncharacterized membrane protein (UPF0136 family)
MALIQAQWLQRFKTLCVGLLIRFWMYTTATLKYSHSVRLPYMSVVIDAFIILNGIACILLFIGGAAAYIRARSLPSLLASVSIGSMFGYAVYLHISLSDDISATSSLFTEQVLFIILWIPHLVAIVASLLLTLVMLARTIVTVKRMPLILFIFGLACLESNIAILYSTSQKGGFITLQSYNQYPAR